MFPYGNQETSENREIPVMTHSFLALQYAPVIIAYILFFIYFMPLSTYCFGSKLNPAK